MTRENESTTMTSKELSLSDLIRQSNYRRPLKLEHRANVVIVVLSAVVVLQTATVVKVR